MSNKFIEWPIKFNHAFDHKRMYDNLVEILLDVNGFLITAIPGVPKINNNEIDWSKVVVSDLIQILANEAHKCTHEHIELLNTEEPDK